jgi:nicotinamidase-related amidase
VTVTVIDPNIALIVIDLQKGFVSLPTVHPFGDIVSNAGALADAFRRLRLPVVLVNVDGSAPGRTEQRHRTADFAPGWSDLVPELNRQPQDHVVTKRTRGAFTNTGLEAHLKNQGVTQVVLAIDAMTDMDADVHHNSVTRIFPKLGETGTTAQIIGLLATRSAAR